VPRWPGAVALLSIEAYYLALSKFVVVLPDMAQYFDLGRWKKRDASSVLTLHEQP
jgi:hypothetical protein